MKKPIVFIVVTFSLMGFSVQASTGKNLTEWSEQLIQTYMAPGMIEIEVEELLSQLDEVWMDEIEKNVTELNNDLENFQSTVSQSAKDSIKSYQKDYENRLLETKSLLMESNFSEYEQRKMKEFNDQLLNEVENFLNGLVSDSKK